MLKLTCPVCDRPEIEGNICPNCETDLSLVIALKELPLIEEQNLVYNVIFPEKQSSKFSLKLALIATLILILGIGLGVMGNSLLAQQQSPPFAVATSVKPTPNLNIKPIPVKSQPPAVFCGGFYYKVKRGDSLSKIASNFYGKSQFLKNIVAANPSLKGRENTIEIGEGFFVPNLEENCP